MLSSINGVQDIALSLDVCLVVLALSKAADCLRLQICVGK